MTSFRRFALAGTLALALGSAFTGLANAAAAGGGGGGGGGAGGGGGGEAAGHISVPTSSAVAPQRGRGGPATGATIDHQYCGYQLLRGHFCDVIRR